MKINFTEIAWDDYVYWQSQDKKTIRRINQLIQDVDRNQNKGIGKPEPHLKEIYQDGGHAELMIKIALYME